MNGFTVSDAVSDSDWLPVSEETELLQLKSKNNKLYRIAFISYKMIQFSQKI